MLLLWGGLLAGAYFALRQYVFGDVGLTALLNAGLLGARLRLPVRGVVPAPEPSGNGGAVCPCGWVAVGCMSIFAAKAQRHHGGRFAE